MIRLMQTASALTLAAALAGVPMIAAAQQSDDTTVKQAVDNAAQETKEAAGATANAVGEAADAAGNAIENAAEDTKDAASDAVQAVTTSDDAAEQKADQVEEAAEDKADAIEQSAEGQGDAVEEAAEDKAEAVEEAGEQKADAIEESADGSVAAEGEEQVKPVEGTITMQDDNTILTSDLLGATVFNAQAEKIGEIDDAILSLDGTVDGVVIGVGGFLGLGEKHVAVEMNQISVQRDEDGDPTLMLDTTKEALKAAPDFVTAADQRSEADRMEAATAPAAGGMSTSDTAPAATPVTPAPADQAPAAPVPAQPAQN